MPLDLRLGNSPRWFMSRPEDADMRIPEIILRCVAFIGRQKPNGDAEFGGTGFFLEVPSEFAPNSKFTYFVTAAHVAEKILSGDFIVRLNHQFYGNFDVQGTAID